jgi:hypothetical protein
MKASRILVVLACAALTVGALAQGGGGGGRQFRMGGGGPTSLLMSFGGRGGGGGGQQSTLRTDVFTDLKISDDQKAKLDDLQAKQREKMQAMFQNGGDRPSQEEMQKIFAKAQEENTKAINDILTPAQQTRLGQVWIQVQGNRAVLNADTGKALGITDDQKTKIDDLVTKQGEANRALRDKQQSGELQADEVRQKMQDNNKSLDTEIGKILTDAQRAKLKDMAGPEFKRTAGK